MGLYINTGNEKFQSARNSEYVDKSGLISIINKTLFTEQRFSCVSRCRRFGKSMAAKMLAAYYDKSCNSGKLFSDLEIAGDASYKQHLNKYPVIYLDMTDFISRFHVSEADIVEEIDATLLKDLHKAYPTYHQEVSVDLMDFLMYVAGQTGDRFIFIIDEWDAICREFPQESPAMKHYVNWLRRLFKSAQAISVFAGVYMTGILPIKKYNTQSALNNFIEYSMINPKRMARYFGFTEEEVVRLSSKYEMDYDEVAKWYDGYHIGAETAIFNPNSVIQSLNDGRCSSYWGATASYDAIVPYITLNFDGLKDSLIYLIAGGETKVNTTKFGNDLSIISSRDDALTALIHLGYLTYDEDTGTCRVPNAEVMQELVNAVEETGWSSLIRAIHDSEALLAATFAGDEDAVAAGIDRAHDENTSILSYNDENSLACVISIAYMAAKKDYVIHRELASGKGFADLVFIPRKNVQAPALIIELKYANSAIAAIEQIKQQKYPLKVEEYVNDLLLVGINYDKSSKKHSCKIERLSKISPAQ